MLFRHFGTDQYFPPIAPDGRVWATPLQAETRREVFSLNSEGIVTAGIASPWMGISGFYYDETCWEIFRLDHTGRRLRFRWDDRCTLVDERGAFLTSIQGYSIPFCLMNRVSFEQQNRYHSPGPGAA